MPNPETTSSHIDPKLMRMNIQDFEAHQTLDHSREIIIHIKCPYCNTHVQIRTFTTCKYKMCLVHSKPESYHLIYAGSGICSNKECYRLLQFLYDADHNSVIRVTPVSYIDFDSKGIPDSIVNMLKEAIICHGNECYTAAAIMVRRTLEEICEQNGVAKSNLRDKLKELEEKHALPEGFVEGLNDIRLLGNDAAHTEKKSYEDIGAEAVAIAIDMTKEALKTLYQYKSIMDRLKSFKKSQPPK